MYNILELWLWRRKKNPKSTAVQFCDCMKVNETLEKVCTWIQVLQFIHLHVELGFSSIFTWTSYTLCMYRIPFRTCAKSTIIVLPDTFSILLTMAKQPEAAVQPNSIFWCWVYTCSVHEVTGCQSDQRKLQGGKLGKHYLTSDAGMQTQTLVWALIA